MNHKYQAVKFLADALSDQTLESSAGYDAAVMMVSHAQVHATLALVEQQRIANLIALTKFAFEQYGNYAPTGANLPALFLPPETEQGNVRLNPDIDAALEINQEGENK